MTTYTLDPLVVRSMLTQAAQGPWTIHYRDGYQSVYAADGGIVADVPGSESARDDASLIACLPDLARDYLHARAELDKLKAAQGEARPHAYRVTHRPLDPGDPWSESVPRDVA